MHGLYIDSYSKSGSRGVYTCSIKSGSQGVREYVRKLGGQGIRESGSQEVKRSWSQGGREYIPVA